MAAGAASGMGESSGKAGATGAREGVAVVKTAWEAEVCVSYEPTTGVEAAFFGGGPRRPLCAGALLTAAATGGKAAVSCKEGGGGLEVTAGTAVDGVVIECFFL